MRARWISFFSAAAHVVFPLSGRTFLAHDTSTWVLWFINDSQNCTYCLNASKAIFVTGSNEIDSQFLREVLKG